jgi:hypothetical protein
MFSDLAGVLTTALLVTAVGIALKPNAPTASVVSSLTNGFSNIEAAAGGATSTKF